MADRYLVGTGNWNSTSVWSATSGGSSGASVPGSGDNAYINSNNTVTLNGDINVNGILHTNGTITCGSYNVQIGYYTDLNNATAKTLNMGSGIWTVTGGSMGATIIRNNNATTVNPETSLVVFELLSGSWAIPGITFNDARINLGSASNSVTVITGGGTFRLLDIRSVNSVSHTITLTNNLTVSKLILIGASTSNRLNIRTNGVASRAISLPGAFTCYGANVSMGAVGANEAVSTFSSPAYLGSSSVVGGTSGGWSLNNPPKISTLIDPLTTSPGSNSNWNVTGTVTGISSGQEGGGYRLSSGSSIRSTDTYDLIDSEIIFERSPRSSSDGKFGVDGIGELVNMSPMIGSMGVWSETFSTNDIAYYATYEGGGGGSGSFTYPISQSKYIKLKVAGTTLTIDYSDDGSSWSNALTETISSSDLPLFRSSRILGLDGTQDVGSINYTPTPPTPVPPTVTTQSVTSIGETTATGNGTVVSDGNSTITERGVCWSTSTNPTTANSKATSAGTTGAFTASMTSLTHSTLYYVRAYAINAEGTSYGDNVTFTTATPPTAPTVTTGSVTDIGTTTATGNGNVTNDGGATITERGVCWNTAPNPTTSNSKATSAGTTGSFSASMTGLNDDTTYYVRAYAINSVGTSYGSEEEFTTDEIPPDVYITQQNGRLLKQQNGRGLIL